MGSTENEKPKKPYDPPTLEIFGKIEDLTKSVARHGKADGGHHVGRMFTSAS